MLDVHQGIVDLQSLRLLLRTRKRPSRYKKTIIGVAAVVVMVTMLLLLIFNFNKYYNSHHHPDGLVAAQEPKMMDRQLIDLNNFEIHSNDTICQKQNSDHKLLQIAILSSRQNFNRRASIRQSWGTVKTYKGWQISTAFLLGSAPLPQTTSDQVIADVISTESRLYGDIVIGSFTDSYRNLTYKHMMGYKWVLDSCPHVDTYVKTDDDVFVNVLELVSWLNSNELKDHFYCYVLHGYLPLRSKRYKFYLSKDEYKPHKFPDYCSGLGYITKPSLMKKLLQKSKHVRYLWVEDLFSTGLLTQHYNEGRSHSSFDDIYSLEVNTSAEVLLKDISQMYLNEQYAVYKDWLIDDSQRENNWLFILLDNKNEQILNKEQRLLWRKTVSNITTNHNYIPQEEYPKHKSLTSSFINLQPPQLIVLLFVAASLTILYAGFVLFSQ